MPYFTRLLLDKRCLLIILGTMFIYLLAIHYGKVELNNTFEGDLGRDLYIYYLSSKGMLPYANFNWIYGPLSPILYGLIFKLGGISILNATTFWYLILAFCTFITYYIVSKITNHIFGFLASTLFYIHYGFFIQTFNHILGVPAILLAIYFFYAYLKDNKKQIYLYSISFSIFWLAMVKLNMGIAMLISSYLLLIIYTKVNKLKWTPILKSLFLTISLISIVYASLIFFSPVDQIIKSFPYGKNYVMNEPYSLTDALFMIEIGQIISIKFIHPIQAQIYYFFSMVIWYVLIFLFGVIFSIYLLKKENKLTFEIYFSIFLSLSLLMLCNEFLLVRTIYSVRFWCLPSCIVLLFFVLNYLQKHITQNKLIKYFFYGIITFIILNIASVYYILSLYNHTASYYFPYTRSKIAITNYPWALKAYTVLDFINKNIKKEEKMLSLPYNTFYNFIGQKDQPGRYTEFLYLSGITEYDERKIIQNLKENNVQWILYGMKYGYIDGGVGHFGKTHCKILDKFIKDNYNIITVISFKNATVSIAPVMFLKKKTN